MSKPARRAALTALAALALLLPAAPALAHGGEAPSGTDFHTTITSQHPAPGITLTAIDAGTRLQLTNHSGHTVDILGSDAEPYLQVRPDGTYENTRSPSTYRNATLAPGNVPADADAGAPPQWRRINNTSTARWHDPRAQWTGPTSAITISDRSRPQRIRWWTIPILINGAPGTLTGALDWQPPPHPGNWWLAILLGTATIGLLGALTAPGTRANQRLGQLIPALLSAIAITGGALAISYAIGRVHDGGTTGASTWWGVLGSQTWPVLTGLGAIAAGGYTLTRRPAGDFALALAGSCLGLFPGLTNTGIFTRAVPPVDWAGSTARTVVAAVTAAGLGMALAGVLRLRAAITAVRT